MGCMSIIDSKIIHPEKENDSNKKYALSQLACFQKRKRIEQYCIHILSLLWSMSRQDHQIIVIIPNQQTKYKRSPSKFKGKDDKYGDDEQEEKEK